MFYCVFVETIVISKFKISTEPGAVMDVIYLLTVSSLSRESSDVVDSFSACLCADGNQAKLMQCAWCLWKPHICLFNNVSRA